MEEPKDQNVYSFMMQVIQEKYGDEVEIDVLNSEADRLYELFGDILLSYFEPQLSPEQKEQFDQLISTNANQDQLLNFLIENIGNLEEQIVQALVNFRIDYIAGKYEVEDEGGQ